MIEKRDAVTAQPSTEPRIRRIKLAAAMDGQYLDTVQTRRIAIEISPAESHRNLVTGCAFTLAAAIVAIGLWVVLAVWLLG